MILTVVLVACIVGILIAVITVYCYRQKSRIRAKLKGLAANGGAVEGEATADYQVNTIGIFCVLGGGRRPVVFHFI